MDAPKSQVSKKTGDDVSAGASPYQLENPSPSVPKLNTTDALDGGIAATFELQKTDMMSQAAGGVMVNDEVITIDAGGAPAHLV